MADIIITATDYQAEVLKSSSFDAPVICSWRQFCQKEFAAANIQTLTAFEEHFVWQDLVEDLQFEHPESICSSFIKADQLMQLYHIPFEALRPFDSEILRLFTQILVEFEAKLRQMHKQTFTRSVRHLCEKKNPVDLSGKTVELYGFVDFPPLYAKLISYLQEQGLDIVQKIPVRNPGIIKAEVYTAPNAAEEFLQALNDIEKLWQAEPNRTFVLVLEPSALSWTKAHRLLKGFETQMLIHCSKPEALVDQLQFIFTKDVFDSLKARDLLLFSRVLISPFWPDDLPRRLLLDLYARERLFQTLSLSEFLNALLHYEPEIFETCWFQTWSRLLDFEPQARDEFIKIYLSAAEFKQMPAEYPEKVHLHITSALEAAMLPVDTVWLLSADKDHYPAQKGFSIFPEDLLLKYNVPAQPVALHHYAQSLLTAICQDHTVFASFVPELRGEEKELSALLKAKEISHFSLTIRRGGMGGGSPAHAMIMRSMEVTHDRTPNDCVKLPFSQKDELINNGITLLKEQAECPFKAFAHFRLQTRALESGKSILNPMQKGSLIHRALEKIWNTLLSQEKLLTLDETALQAFVAGKVRETLNQLERSSRKEIIRKLEQNRLTRIITAWLMLEKQRPPFHVQATEASTLVNLGGIQFAIRLDRIDETERGILVIDYKTGEVNHKNWFDERLRDPQLPLYAITHSATGALFASLKVGKMGISGVVAHESMAFDAARPLADQQSWQRQCEKWRSQLEEIMQEHIEGCAEVAPIDEKACLYCDLSGLCRIKEKNLQK